MTSSLSKRAGPLFGVVLVVGGLLAAFTPYVPAVRALDPSPDPVPAATPDPTPDPTLAPTPDPTLAPTPDPTAAPDPVPAPTDAPTDPPAPTDAPTDAPTIDPGATPAPSVDPSADPGMSPDPSASIDPAASALPSPSPSATPVPDPLSVTHAWVDTVSDEGTVTATGALDEPRTGAARYSLYHVRFQVVNDGPDPIVLDSALQLETGAGFVVVPEVDPVIGTPFYAASDDGTRFRVRRAAIPVAKLRLDTADARTAVEGLASAGENPLAGLAIPANGFSELEFAVRATIDARWETAYHFRLVDGPRAVAGGEATITMGAKPPVELSPGQKAGRAVQDPVPLYRLDPTIGMTDLPSNGSTTNASVATYALRGPVAAAGPYVSPHTNYTLTTDACASCHATHTAQADMLLRQAPPESTLCFTCHDGSGAQADIKAQYTSPSVPANDDATSAYYSHPATSPSATTHTDARSDEFGGVLNRHAACADCHQPHNADGTKPVDSVGGWTASGAIKGANGVGVTNGPAGATPLYALKKTADFEYELCFKCHSGFTQLPAQDPAHPSRWALDKGVELNPANVSYHPVEAAGKNQTGAMAQSLAGTSPYKLWAFETNETVRCASCHGNSAAATPAAPPGADALLDNHASPNRGILIAPYRDRTLKPQGQLYGAQDFSLCYVCHAEAPMVDDSGDVRFDTNFNWHGFHLNAISFRGTGGTDIDVAGAGQGNAVCAECHFRIHGDALAVNGQAPAKGLVNFAPNVEPRNGTLGFVPATPSTLGTCTLTCHGKPHDAYVYAAAP